MHRRPMRFYPMAAIALLTLGCASRAEPPEPGHARGAVPDLRGRSVMVLPVQLRNAVPQGILADEELAHALRDRGGSVTWTFPPEMEEILRRSPGLSARIHGLPVGVFLQAEVDRVGDPLFRDFVRLAGITGAEVALLPVQLGYGSEGRYALNAALLSTRTGRVIWYGIVEGDVGAPDHPAALASVAEALARTVLPLG